MDLFKGLFDLDDDGNLGSTERAFEFGAVEELLEEDEDEYGDDFEDEDEDEDDGIDHHDRQDVRE